VDVIADSHNPDDIIPETEPALAQGLILQREIRYFREARGNVDVVRGEILPAYVERVREDDGKLDIGLRAFGGKAKAEQVSTTILDRLDWAPGGTLDVGDKSTPQEIAKEFPGVSKGTFKKAVAALYKQGKVQPGPYSISLIRSSQKDVDQS
jgi:predicted RNA-binding protein (virulence factor B family)